MKAIIITLIVSLAAMSIAYDFTHQQNFALYRSESGAMSISPNRGNI